MDPGTPTRPSVTLLQWACTIGFLVLFLADVYHAGTQYYSTPLDGDMNSGILITWDVQKILDDPLGFRVISTGHGHANPNRYFCHWGFASYFRGAPFLLQRWMDPLQSVYLSCALLKVFIHAGLVLMLGLFVRSREGAGWMSLPLLMVLVGPLLQVEHYRDSIGIIDHSTTYAYFYALPALGFLVLVGCFHLLFRDSPLPPLLRTLVFVFTLCLSLILPLSGPLVAPCVLLGAFVIAVRMLSSNGLIGYGEHLKRHRWALGLLLWLLVVCAYSLWLGSYNAVEEDNQPPLSELYARLPQGLDHYFTSEPAIALLVAFVLLNGIILRLSDRSVARSLFRDMGWFLVFILLYVVLLPMGGYRPWRENLIRFDTMIPFTLGLFYFHLLSTYRVILHLRTRKWLYGLVLGALLFHFTVSDLELHHTNACQVRMIERIARSSATSVRLNEDCAVISWDVITTPQRSVAQGELLALWRITDEPKRFYYRAP
jgi:hypothetical protein